MFRSLALLLVLALIWSSSFMAIKVAVETVPPVTLAAARVVIAAAVLWAAARAQGQRLPTDVRFWVFCFLIGLVGNGLPFTLIGWGEQRIASGLTAILMSVMPLATVVMAHFFTAGDRMTPGKIFGVGFGFGGIVLLVGPDALAGLGGDFWHELAVAGGALCYSVAVILARNTPPAPLLARSAAVMIMASLLMTPAAFVLEAPLGMAVSADSVLASVYLGVFPTGVATIIFFHLVQVRGASFMAFVNYLIPVFGVLWGVALLGERPTVTEIAALAVILSGIAAAQVGRSR